MPELFEDSDVHVHVPAGAIPKDGPSAGVAMFVSLASLFKNAPVRPDVAMTGEITLRGLVLPVGGIKEKTIAAARAGIKRVILPARNRRDLEDIPPSTRSLLEFVWMSAPQPRHSRSRWVSPPHRQKRHLPQEGAWADRSGPPRARTVRLSREPRSGPSADQWTP